MTAVTAAVLLVVLSMPFQAQAQQSSADQAKPPAAPVDPSKMGVSLDRIRREIWHDNPPATTGVGIVELEQGAEVEIEAVAIVDEASGTD